MAPVGAHETRIPRVVIAMDSFKGSLGSRAAGDAVADGVRAAVPLADIAVVTVADGGEGTLEAAEALPGARRHWRDGSDLLGRVGPAPWVGWEDTCIVESASLAGLALLDRDGADAPHPSMPARATSYGLGLQVRGLIEHEEASTIAVGLGGTGCTDGGTGFIVGLGGEVRDADGRVLDPREGNPLLRGAAQVALPDLRGVRLLGLTDVTAPLTGPDGAAQMFAPQKGADAAMVSALEAGMSRWEAALPAGLGATPGAGAAGGLGAAVLAVGGELTPGAAWLIEEAAGPLLANADLVITGEGSIDRQSAAGKTPHAVAAMARRGAARVIALGGGVHTRSLAGVDAVLPIHTRPRPLAEAMGADVTSGALAHAGEQVAALVLAPGTR